MDSYRKQMLLKSLRGKYFFLFIAATAAYIFFNVWINELGWSQFSPSNYTWWFYIPRTILFFAVSLFTGLVFSLIWLKIDETKKMSRASGIGMLGAMGGLLAGGCAGCVAGIFPAILAIFGLNGTLGVLPLYGFEISIISIILLTMATYFLTRSPVCKVEPTTDNSTKKQ